jgi:hypothetical protein
MGYIIGLADLAANAFIALLKIDNTRRFISFESLEIYGATVVNILKQQGYDASLELSRSSTYQMLDQYGDVFDIAETEMSGLQLKDDVDIIDLIDRFSGYLPVAVLLAFKTAGEQLELC